MTKYFLNIAGGVLMTVLSVALVFHLISGNPLEVELNSTTHPEARTISVSGEGKVSAVPDIAHLNISVVSEAKTVKDVIDDNIAKMNQVITKMKDLGIAEEDMVTSAYNLNPKYYYPENKERQITGYRLNQTLALKIRNLDLVDNVIDEATNLGVNNVSGLSFGLDDDSGALAEAREKAFAAAKEKAQMMAKAAGVKLGKVYSFSENNGYQPPVPVYYAEDARMEKAGSAAPNIQSGSQEYSVTVNMTYEIE